jgi:hypothetical protein
MRKFATVVSKMIEKYRRFFAKLNNQILGASFIACTYEQGYGWLTIAVRDSVSWSGPSKTPLQ